MIAVRNGKKIIPPNLLIELNIILCNCLFTKHRHTVHDYKEKHNVEDLMEVSHCCRFNFHSWN